MAWNDETIGPDVAAAGRLISETISRDLASCDLYDALDAVRYSSHPYSSPPKEWPSFVEVVNARELPAILIERYNAAGGQGTALCGIFPSIRRAWATVDNSLFLWRFDKWDGVCPEYSGEEQAICAVGLAKVRPNIFLEAIQHLLVLATPVEIILLGVCCSGSNDGMDAYAELSLQPLPEYSIPSDGVTMTCIESTDKGRIFLAGRDGHIYELLYTTGTGWKSRCRVVCQTGGLGSLLTRWVLPNSFTFRAVDPVIEMAIDNERNVLFSRTQESKIQVFDLGKNGDGALKKVAEEKNVGDQRESRHRGGTAAGRGTSRIHKTSIVSIAVISPMESRWLHLVAVASDGRRIYLSTFPSLGGGGINGTSSTFERPSVLRVVMTRHAPLIGTGGVTTLSSLSMGGCSQTESVLLKVEASHYSCGVFMVSDSSPPMSRLLVAARDWTAPSLTPGNLVLGTELAARNLRALREMVTVLGVDGRSLAISDVLPSLDKITSVEASVWEGGDLWSDFETSEMTKVRRLWARGDLTMQHIIPRRKTIIFCNMGLMEVAFNRPVDILQKLLEGSAPRIVLEDFFHRYGAGEASAMCLLLAARLTSNDESTVSSSLAERAAESFEDQRLVGIPQMQGANAMTNAVQSGGGFNMGQVVQEPVPIYSGAHEGLCLCTSRLLWPIWELPVVVTKGDAGVENGNGGVISCRLSMEALQALEDKIRSLEQFLRSRRNQRRGQYGRILGLGDFPESFGNGKLETVGRNLFGVPRATVDTGTIQGSIHKKQRVPYNPTELAVMEVRSMELIRRLLRRSGEALLLLRLLSQHHITRLSQSLDPALRKKLVHLTFHHLVCSEEGDQIATRLVAALMEYYIGPDGRGTVNDISVMLREGCPSYYQERDYTFFQAVECLEKAAATSDTEQRDNLAREALALLRKVPETADLLSVCQRLESLRFYEAIVELPLRKAKAVDPNEDALNEQIDNVRCQAARAAREECYEVITNALRSLQGENADHAGFGCPSKEALGRTFLDHATREKYIRQIVQLGVKWPDRLFHEYLYWTMIELGMESELLELAGPDIVPFLQNAGSFQTSKAGFGASRPNLHSMTSTVNREQNRVTMEQAKYLELLSRYYVHKRQHILAAHVLLRLAERKQVECDGQLTLEQRYQYLSNAVLQTRSTRSSVGTSNFSSDVADGGLSELLEGKLAVLKFQMKIMEELERIVAREAPDPTQHTDDGLSGGSSSTEQTRTRAAKEKAQELGQELKTITQLYNDYAVPFELWEICLEILHFSSYAGDADNIVMRETWARLLDQALNNGGVAEACNVLRRVGPQLFPGSGASMPLDMICFHLEKAAQERVTSGAEIIGDEDIPRALLVACKGSVEPVLRTYDRLLSSGTVLPSPTLRLRMLRSVLMLLREWAMTALPQHMGTNTSVGSLALLSTEQSISRRQGIKDKLCSASNRYMTELMRLPFPTNQVEGIYRGFKEFEEMLLGSHL